MANEEKDVFESMAVYHDFKKLVEKDLEASAMVMIIMFKVWFERALLTNCRLASAIAENILHNLVARFEHHHRVEHAGVKSHEHDA